jgi:hypothetical protein
MRAVVVVLSLSLLLGLSRAASAAYLIDPTGGTALTSLFSAVNGGATGELDNGSTSGGRALGFSFNFYGSAITSIFVSTNGSLTNSFNISNADVGWSSSPGSTQRIAPAWDDYQIDPVNDSVIEKKTADYYSATWNVRRINQVPGSNPTMKMQAVLIGSATTLQGFNFQPGDIAFSYNGMQTPHSGGATIGVRQTASNFQVPCSAATPCAGAGVSSDGRITTYSDPIYTSAGTTFFLFRPNAGNGYDVSLESFISSAVPEPGALGLIALAALPGVILLRRRRS